SESRIRVECVENLWTCHRCFSLCSSPRNCSDGQGTRWIHAGRHRVRRNPRQQLHYYRGRDSVEFAEAKGLNFCQADCFLCSRIENLPDGDVSKSYNLICFLYTRRDWLRVDGNG